MTCSSVSDCWTVGESDNRGVVYATVDGGGTWDQQTLPVGFETAVEDLVAISCPTSVGCYSVGEDTNNEAIVVATTNGGATWPTMTALSGVLRVLAISCPSRVRCWTVGTTPGGHRYVGTIATTANGGKTWSPETVPADVISVTGVSCPDVAHCWATAQGTKGQEILSMQAG